MTEELITFETAVLAKEKGFDEECLSIYYPDNDFHEPHELSITYRNSRLSFAYRKGAITAASQSLLQRWLRERHEIWIYVMPKLIIEQVVWVNNTDVKEGKKEWGIYHNTYEKALEAGLQYGLKQIKDD